MLAINHKGILHKLLKLVSWVIPVHWDLDYGYGLGPYIRHTHYWRGQRHRVDGPAVTTYHNGSLFEVQWYLDGKFHRIDGPASTTYWSNGDVGESWLLNGKMHRETGPAYNYQHADGRLSTQYYLHDVRCHEDWTPFTQAELDAEMADGTTGYTSVSGVNWKLEGF